MKPLIIIAAMDTKRGIGKDNKLPWNLRGEYIYFQRIIAEVKNPDLKNVVIMGRRTWVSIPAVFKPLKNIFNIVLSTTLSDVPEGVIIEPNLTQAMKAINKSPFADQVDKVFIAGGSGVYKEAIESGHCDTIYLTHMLKDFACDTFFPEFDEKLFKGRSDPDVPEGIREENGIKYEHRLYERKSNL